MDTSHYFRYGVVGLILSACAFLSAEVEQVIIKWNPGLCLHTCVKGLEQRFQRIPGVESIEMNEPNGMATIKWKSNVPFSFVPLNYALRWIGIRQDDVRVRVRGSISVFQKTYSIISKGDHTRFVLLNRVSSNPNQYVERFNPADRQLSTELEAKLNEAKENNATVVIEGPLFMPLRSPPDPLRLVIDQMQVNPQSQSFQQPSY